ncbi:uncharacterized protein LOC133815755 [Humulus lupulus]|uniref:uncharacterized protein LOC133815755 n=1 Tax=Humulus lupulus TaxID=3486 RepID=UPI002B40A89E|nr:uncharacterized protein LOC133815755 [Humulus lupulus]
MESFAHNHLRLHHSKTSQPPTNAIALFESTVLYLTRESLSQPHLIHLTRSPMPYNITEFFKSQPLTLSWDNDNHSDDDHGDDRLRVRCGGKLNAICTHFKGYHCNGIICFQHYYDRKVKIVFYNPTLRQCKILDQPQLSVPDYWRRTNGFGYDRRSKVYKYVEIFFKLRGYKAQICSLSSSSHTWSEIDISSDVGKFIGFSGVYLNSVYYWNNGSSYGVVSFDMCTEKFSIISLIPETDYCSASLSVWKNESVVLLTLEPRESYFPITTSYRMWVLTDDSNGGGGGGGGGPYWRNHLVIGPLPPSKDLFHCLDFWSDEELLIRRVKTYQKILSYNIRSKRIRELDIPHNLTYVSLTLYSKSLVSLFNHR